MQSTFALSCNLPVLVGCVADRSLQTFHKYASAKIHETSSVAALVSRVVDGGTAKGGVTRMDKIRTFIMRGHDRS